MIWVLVAIMSVGLIVMAITAKDKVREICLKVFCVAVTIFLIVGTAESFYGDIFKVTVSSQDKTFEIREFEKYGDLDETIYAIQTDVSNTRYLISDVNNKVEVYYKSEPKTLIVTKKTMFDVLTFSNSTMKVFKIY